jgi:tetratricopeptide (TPR) repeat protein
LSRKSISLKLSILVFGFFLLANQTTANSLFDSKNSPNKLKKEAERALRKGHFNEAENWYRQLLAIDSQNQVAMLGLSFVLLKQRQLDKAFTQINETLKLNDRIARAYSIRGAALLGSGFLNRARDDFQTAIVLNEKEPLAISGLATIAMYENRLAESIRGFRRAVSLEPYEPDYYFSLTQATTRAKLYTEASHALAQFLDIAPNTDKERRDQMRAQVQLLRFLGKQLSVFESSGANNSAISFEIVNNRPILNVRINDSKAPLRFVLDTGSYMTVISDETARRLKIRPVAKGGRGRGIGGHFNIVYGFIHTLNIGEVRVEGLPVFIRPFYQDSDPVDGYLGTSAIANFLTTVDYQAKSLKLLRQDATVAVNSQINRIENGTTLRTTSNGLLSGEVKVEGFPEPLHFVIDTGATTSVLSEEFVSQSGLKALKSVELTNVLGAAGIEKNVSTLFIPSLNFGGFVQENVRALVLNLKPINETTGFQQVGIIGGNVLRNFRVTFDFQRTMVHLEPTTGLKSPVKQNQLFNISTATIF